MLILWFPTAGYLHEAFASHTAAHMDKTAKELLVAARLNVLLLDSLPRALVSELPPSPSLQTG